MSADPSQPAARFDAVDALRGFAMVWMTAFHFCFDLNQYGYIRQNFYVDPFWTWQRVVIVSLFLVIPSRDGAFEITVASGIGLVVLGMITGTLSGLLGVGGGIFVVPMLVLLFGVSDLAAKGTSLLMMIPTALSGTVGNLRNKNVDIVAALLIGGAACTTTALGAWLSKSIDPMTGNIVFAVFLLAVGARMALQALRNRY